MAEEKKGDILTVNKTENEENSARRGNLNIFLFLKILKYSHRRFAKRRPKFRRCKHRKSNGNSNPTNSRSRASS